MARTTICNDCKGTGIIGTGEDQKTCPSCLGGGTRVSDYVGVIQDINTITAALTVSVAALDTKIDILTTSQTAQDVEIADIKAKCTHIKNKVNDIKDVVDAIKVKVDTL